MQRSKCYVTDSGLCAVLTGLSTERLSSPAGVDYLGAMLELFVVDELARQREWSQTPFELAHYRDRNGAEVDIIIETGEGVIAVEVKATSSARPVHFKHLANLRDRLGEEFLAGVVLNLGPPQLAGDRLHALPVTTLWGR